jgi:hypothetical protein
MSLTQCVAETAVSLFEKTFPPYHVRAHVTLAPVHRMRKSSLSELEERLKPIADSVADVWFSAWKQRVLRPARALGRLPASVTVDQLKARTVKLLQFDEHHRPAFYGI